MKIRYSNKKGLNVSSGLQQGREKKEQNKPKQNHDLLRLWTSDAAKTEDGDLGKQPHTALQATTVWHSHLQEAALPKDFR